MNPKTIINKSYDVIVVGGGMSGICAAIASARGGAKTALVQNRPVLGGNASSEIRMHICGADNHGHRPDARETGILEEILLENKRQNPTYSYAIFDQVLWEKVRFQEGLDLYLNAHMTEVITEGDQITKIYVEQLTTEKAFEFCAKLFIDTTGDATLAYLSGAEYTIGREGKYVYGEKHAPDETDQITMGNTLLFKTVDTGHPIPFIKPFWANTYEEEDLKFRDHGAHGYNYWWIEIGGDQLEVIADGEEIRDELLKAVYGVWDHIKNGGQHQADNYALDWVGFLPGKRESRRIVGDYVLTEEDLVEGRCFEDAIAYGGWPMDMHVVGGLRTRLEPTEFIHLNEVYTIPYRCLYSKNIHNLMVGGRAISTSHMAFGSTRVMGTCAVVGQAIGAAAALSIQKGILPRQMLEHIQELQQSLLEQDIYIPSVIHCDEKDVAKSAKVIATSFEVGCEPDKIINGWDRKIKSEENCWAFKADQGRQWIQLEFLESINAKEVILKFDSNLSKQIMPSMFDNGLKDQEAGIPKELIKAYDIEFYREGQCTYTLSNKNNYLRYRKHYFETPIGCDQIRIVVNETNGVSVAKIFEVRVYE